MKSNSRNSIGSSAIKSGILTVAFLALVLCLLFFRSFLPDYVHFSNDSPLGQQNASWMALPSGFSGTWYDLNDVGFPTGSLTPSASIMIKWFCGPLGYSKFYIPIALFILGLGAWTFFRALRMLPWAAAMGSLAMMLSATFFSGACWGVASAEIAVGVNCFAMALVTANNRETRWHVRTIRLALAGLCVGMNVIEAADIGALCSIFVALYVFYQSLMQGDKALGWKVCHGIGRVAVVAVFAASLALQAVVGLINTNVVGIAGTKQDTQTKQQRWDFATQWSLPKKETLGVFIPGLFGYKMDTPKDMTPAFENAFRNGAYWGGMGRDPSNDRWLDSGAQGNPPGYSMRFGYAGYYSGILVALLALWSICQSLRGVNSVFDETERRFIWFWTAVMVGSLVLAWGRFAPMFYGILYQIPHFSDIRNPAKFFLFFTWAWIVLFAYGVHALNRRYLDINGRATAGLTTQVANWWAKAGKFDRNWVYGSFGAIALSLVGYAVISHEMPAFVQYLAIIGFGGDDPTQDNSGAALAAFSLHSYAWFIGLLAVAALLVIVVMSGYFSGTRAKAGMIILSVFFLFDLGRADLPWVIHWDYKQKYEIGTLNPVVDFLRNEPYEHRVAGLPFNYPQEFEVFAQLYRVEWMQHHFPYYNIQCLDIIQMARMAEDLKSYLEGLSPRDQSQAWLYGRRWELSNTRYLLGPAGYLDVLNRDIDPAHQSFHILKRFEIVLKPGVLQFHQRLEELTAVLKDDGNYALFEYGNALPRAKLYGTWQVNTNSDAILNTLADINFDPQKAVLISTPEKDLPNTATNENTGTVEYKSYASKDIVLSATASGPSVLLLNDKYDPHWTVNVDGKPSPLLHCNYLMRGVQIPAGTHTVEFKLDVHDRLNALTLFMYGVATLLALALWGFTATRAKEPGA